MQKGQASRQARRCTATGSSSSSSPAPTAGSASRGPTCSCSECAGQLDFGGRSTYARAIGGQGSILGFGGPWALLATLACTLALALAGGCGDDDGDVAADLNGLLAPPEELGLELEVEREFEWDNATDFIVEGVHLPEATPPSEVIEAIEDEGFVAGAGQLLKDEKDQKFAGLDVAAFDSEEGAQSARDRLHEQNLKQPCFGACVVTPVEHTVDEVPNSVAVHQEPNEGKPPPGLGKFEAYAIEFTIGSRLYVLQADGPPGVISEADFERAANAVYEHAAAQT